MTEVESNGYHVPGAEALETLDAYFELWDRQLCRLEAELPSYIETGRLPEWYNQEGVSTYGLANEVKNSAQPVDGVSRHFALHSRFARVFKEASGYEVPSGFQVLTDTVGVDVVAKAFNQEPSDGVMHQGMLERLDNDDNAYLKPELDVMRRSYEVESATELLSQHSDQYGLAVRTVLSKRRMLAKLAQEDGAIDYAGTPANTKRSTHQWMQKALSLATGISLEEARGYTYTASRRVRAEDLAPVLEKFEYFGADRLRAIRQSTGIEGVEAYSTSQLERMEALVNDPQAEAKRLAEHDVTVLMVNRSGDHNGVLQDSADMFDDDSRRTIFMEITSMGDIYRRMAWLHEHGIKPSTLALAAHSAEGQFIVADRRDLDRQKLDIATIAGRQLVRMAHKNGRFKEGERGYSMHGMEGMARLVDTYMNPSRGIDDDSQDIGRKKIILQSCYAASEIDMNDRDHNDTSTRLGTSSVIRRLADDLAVRTARSVVDIYGAQGGVQLHGTVGGVRFSSDPSPLLFERLPLEAQRLHVEPGVVSADQVAEIKLRRTHKNTTV